MGVDLNSLLLTIDYFFKVKIFEFQMQLYLLSIVGKLDLYLDLLVSWPNYATDSLKLQLGLLSICACLIIQNFLERFLAGLKGFASHSKPLEMVY